MFGGTSLVTTAPAATTAPSLIVTFRRIVAWAPIQTFLPMRIGPGNMSCLCAGSRSWSRVAMTTCWPISDPSPIQMPPWSWKQHPSLMNTSLPMWMFMPKSAWNGGNILKPSPTGSHISSDMMERISSIVWYLVLRSIVMRRDLSAASFMKAPTSSEGKAILPPFAISSLNSSSSMVW